MAEIESGSITLFRATTPPVGWTKITTYDDHALRLVSGTVGTGGTVSFTNCYSTITPTGTVSASATVGGTTLSTDQLPTHNHTTRDFGSNPVALAATTTKPPTGAGWIDPVNGGPGGSLGNWRTTADLQSPITDKSLQSFSAGNDGSHTHPLVSVNMPSPSYSPSNSLDLRIKYVDVILAQRD